MKSWMMLALCAAGPAGCLAQSTIPFSIKDKLVFHAKQAYAPGIVVGIAAIAGYQQLINMPGEWGQGGEGYGHRFGSVLAISGIRGTLSFGLDTMLHEDPRYYRSESKNFFRRAAHAVTGTILTRTDSGAGTLSMWRLGGDYGAAFLSDTWYPGRLDTPRHAVVEGSLIMALDLAGNLGAEFWPDIRKKVFHK